MKPVVAVLPLMPAVVCEVLHGVDALLEASSKVLLRDGRAIGAFDQTGECFQLRVAQGGEHLYVREVWGGVICHRESVGWRQGRGACFGLSDISTRGMVSDATGTGYQFRVRNSVLLGWSLGGGGRMAYFSEQARFGNNFSPDVV
jgi:hypothetical protein